MSKKGDYQFPPEQIFLKEKMLKDKSYTFSDVLSILREEFPEVKGNRVTMWLDNLETDGDILRLLDEDKAVFFKSTKGLKKAVGIVEWQTRGHALVHVTDENKNKTGETIFLPRNEAALVINGEFVRVKRIPSIWRGKESSEDEGLVVSVLETKVHHTIAQVAENTKRDWHGAVRILEPMLNDKIKLSERYETQVSESESARIKEVGMFLSGTLRRSGDFERWSGIRGFFDPIKSLGKIDDYGIETKLALEWMNVKEGFSANSLKEAESSNSITSNDLLKDKGRKDLRNLKFVTIDGESTEDFDDALYAEKTKTGLKLFVAIADVSRYVVPYSDLDIEAKSKATTYYMPHRVIPMLPETLSKGVCSLNPNEERAAIVLEVDFDNNGKLINKSFYPALVKSFGRLTYDEVDYFYKGLNERNFGEPAESEQVNRVLLRINVDGWNEKFGNILKPLFECASILNKERNPIPFDRDPEIKYSLNKKGKISNLYIDERETPANKLVEECMLLTNRSAAQILAEKGTNSVLFRNQKAPEEGQSFLRSAKYENNNIGHYALGHEYYMHFTSPIRRYPDLMAHRELKNILGFSTYLVPDSVETEEIGIKCTEIQRLSKGARIKADNWLIVQFAETMKKEPEKALIIRENDKGWIVQGEKTNLQGYVSKPRDKAEEQAVLEAGLSFEVDRVDFLLEKVFLKSKAPVLSVSLSTPEKDKTDNVMKL